MEKQENVNSFLSNPDSKNAESPNVSFTKKSSLKRSASESPDYETSTKNIQKSISFSAVTAYYFPREQGFISVPSQGGSTLGMGQKHIFVEEFTLSEYASQRRKARERFLSERRKKLSFKCEDSSYILQPVSTRGRKTLLREAGVAEIESKEKDDCRKIRTSREECGCSCESVCLPDICHCAVSGIQCQVDRLSFPCGCTEDGCGNPAGRVEFNSVRVQNHFLQTMMRVELEVYENAEKNTVKESNAS